MKGGRVGGRERWREGYGSCRVPPQWRVWAGVGRAPSLILMKPSGTLPCAVLADQAGGADASNRRSVAEQADLHV